MSRPPRPGAGLRVAVRELIADATLASARSNAADATGWISVSIDLESGSLDVVGPFAEPESALIYGARSDAAANDGLPPSEAGWRSLAVPLFAPEGPS